MDIIIRRLLLKVLSENGNVDALERAGYQYASIANEYSQLINDNLIVANDKMQFVLSEKGRLELKKLNEEINSTGRWRIEPYVKYKSDKMDKYDIFIE